MEGCLEPFMSCFMTLYTGTVGGCKLATVAIYHKDPGGAVGQQRASHNQTEHVIAGEKKGLW